MVALITNGACYLCLDMDGTMGEDVGLISRGFRVSRQGCLCGGRHGPLRKSVKIGINGRFGEGERG